MVRKIKRWVLWILAGMLISSMGCRTTYYAVWEQLGKEKRHLLRDQIDKTRSDQEKATEEYKDVLTRIKELYGFDGGNLENFYKKLLADYEDCQARAEKLDDRIKTVDQTAQDLFREWSQEIELITNDGFKKKSRQQLQDTRSRYSRLYETMIRSRSQMDPILKNLNDYVLFLKHNLNAQAIGSLKQEMESIESGIGLLIKDIDKSIQEADDFLRHIE